MTADVLTLADIGTAGTWQALETDPGGVATYSSLLRLPAGATPAGIAVVWARRAFSRGRPLPAGGVLLGIDVDRPGELPLPHGPDGFRVDVDVRSRPGRRPVVTIAVALRSGVAEPFVRVTFVLLWPEPA